ncbi:hypothetical protein MuYL_4412 [Mucilaginibacter xinganensis]|uniref:Uncharacterized protein n=2 Tax=Mucilaginibacter xinganensis TaxID=1234841 RepID=A0A223P2G6_9SPHI|nr:hypothetical protein MuYL_4412 [Mucilaginibacter xinganensis]
MPPAGTDPKIALYGDSVFYIQSADLLVKPVVTKAGTYSSLPEGLKIDEVTGEIDVNKSETGLKYQVTFTPADASGSQVNYVVISGINYEDKIYNLSAGDSVATPIYNANARLTMPDAGLDNVFDESGGCKNAGIAVDPKNARINLAQTVRNQAIDTGATQEVKLAYRINDKSEKALNGLNVKIYFYRNASEIPQYLIDLINERKTTILYSGAIIRSFALNTSGLKVNVKKPARPRPPCIIVVGN